MAYRDTTNSDIVHDARLLSLSKEPETTHTVPSVVAATPMTAEDALAAAEREGLTLARTNTNSTGFTNVYNHTPNRANRVRKRPFEVMVRDVSGLIKSLGYYPTPEEAALVRARHIHSENIKGRETVAAELPPKAKKTMRQYPKFCTRKKENDGKSVYTCDFCDKKYMNRDGARVHCIDKHGLKPIDTETTPMATTMTTLMKRTRELEPTSFLAIQSLTNDPEYKKMIDESRLGHTPVPSMRVLPTTTNSAYKRMIKGLPTNPDRQKFPIIGTPSSFTPLSQQSINPSYAANALNSLKRRRLNGGKKRTRRKIQKTKRKIQKTKNGKYKKHTKKHKFIIK